METLVLTQNEIEKILDMKDVMKAVENAFKLHGLGKTQMPAKIYLTFEKGDLRAMPACLNGKAGIKWVNSHPSNREVGLPTVMALLIYNDPETGFPLAVMDATHITNMRTGAAGGIAAMYLAKKDSRIFGFIGAGTQARTQIMALKEVFKVERVKVYDINKKSLNDFSKFCEKMGIDIEVTDAKNVCKCDVLTTSTPSRKPVVKNSWINEGMHINAIGADAPGKQELDEEILLRAKIVVDDYEQAIHGGEINVAISKGVIKREDIYATLGEIITGVKKGREGNEITVFDSTGLAIQDIATASVVFEKAVKMGAGMKIKFFEVEI